MDSLWAFFSNRDYDHAIVDNPSYDPFIDIETIFWLSHLLVKYQLVPSK